MKPLRFSERGALCQNHFAKKLFLLLEQKKTNLALSADVTDAQALLDLAFRLGPEICILKTHIDIIQDFTPQLIQDLKKIAQEKNFLLFEDRKFADIGNTVKHQFLGGIYQIASWADMINAHCLPGPGVITGLQSGLDPDQCGLLLIAEMSSESNLLSEEYRRKTIEMAEAFPECVIGFIAQQKLSKDPRWLYLTPGVQFQANRDALGQHYTSPEDILIKQESDIIIVGRGIYEAKDPLSSARQYREVAWNAYEKRCAPI